MGLGFGACRSPVKVRLVEAGIPGLYSGGATGTAERSARVSSSSLLQKAGLAGSYRRDPAGAVARLEEQLAARPTDDALRRSLCQLSIRVAEKRSRTDAAAAAGLYLTAAKHASGLATKAAVAGSPDEWTDLYNHSVAHALARLDASGFEWSGAPAAEGSAGVYRITIDRNRPRTVDPATFDAVLAADTFEIDGFQTRAYQSGLGGTLVAHREATPERRTEDPSLPELGRSVPVTAIAEFGGGDDAEVVFTFYDVLLGDRAVVADREVQLAADFTAPLAHFMRDGPGDIIGFRRMLKPGKYAGDTGLFLLEPYRPQKIPVVFVHGLMSRPATWRDTYNGLMSHRHIRENYQFWFFRYPTGYPIVQNAASLRNWKRKTLERIDPERQNPHMQNAVLIGHSMGGLLASFQVREGGDRIWNQLFRHALDELELDEASRQELRELIYFKPEKGVKRVVFIATPHRGSPLAQNFGGRLGSWLIKLPRNVLSIPRRTLLPETTESGRSLLSHPTDSIRALSEDSPGLKMLIDLPMNEDLIVHSIIGDQGKGGTPDSSDGWVPYRSAHLDGAASEKIVPASHQGAQGHPETVVELERILSEHLRR